MAVSKLPKRYAPTDLDNSNIAAGAGIVTSKLADGAEFVKRDGAVAFTGNVSHGGFKITNLGTPAAGTSDAARISDVENQITASKAMFDGKDSVRVATTANGALASAFANGSVVDGVTLATGDRILVKNQTASAENGIYTVNATGAPTRATDFDAWAEIPGGTLAVEEGTTQADTIWLSTANQGGTLGTTSITFQQVGVQSGLNNTNFVDQETPSGTVNGSNTAFTLANTPVAGSVHLWLEGWFLFPGAGNDYTISASSITMLTAPLTGERLRASYRK